MGTQDQLTPTALETVSLTGHRELGISNPTLVFRLSSSRGGGGE